MNIHFRIRIHALARIYCFGPSSLVYDHILTQPCCNKELTSSPHKSAPRNKLNKDFYSYAGFALKPAATCAANQGDTP